jgi:vacuolar-type H+-ATPase subunit E/Vma4
MGLEVVIKEIRDKGQAEADQIRRETQAEVASILEAMDRSSKD